MSSLIPCTRFLSLPTDCPVRVERERRRGRYIGKDNLGWIEVEVDDGVHLFDPAEVWVDVARSNADIRAYVPDLICAVAALPQGARPMKEPTALWDSYFGEYRLVDILSANGIVVSRFAHGSVSGKTREECLLNGLFAGLELARATQ